MGKSKNKTRSEVEHLRGQVRQLKAELKYYKRREHISNEPDDLDYDDVQDITAAKSCPACKRGIIKIIDLLYVNYEVCENCEYKKKL